ncbi:MAG: 16S rRNA processing protein RimM [Bdellovibrionaceae bacterium]|nr:16S rRNA processing protein RimM [Pseudobdellovibrionaceae bacterium]
MTHIIEKYYSVGRVKEAHGLRGDLYIKLRSKRADWLEQLDRLILSESETPLNLNTFRLKKKKFFREGLLVQVEEIKDRTSAEKCRGLYMLIPTSYLMTSNEKDFYLYEVQGFEVIDKTLLSIGNITGFGSNGAQDLLEVTGPFGKVDILFIYEFIERISFDEKKIYMNLPLGMVQINED